MSELKPITTQEKKEKMAEVENLLGRAANLLANGLIYQANSYTQDAEKIIDEIKEREVIPLR